MYTCKFKGIKHQIIDFIQDYPYPTATTLRIKTLDGSRPYCHYTIGGADWDDETTVRHDAVTEMREEADPFTAADGMENDVPDDIAEVDDVESMYADLRHDG